MGVDFQELFNIAVALVSTLAGFVLKAVWDGIKDLQTSDKELTEKVHSIERIVVGDYVRKDDLERMNQAVLNKLDRIETKLDKKVDKP